MQTLKQYILSTPLFGKFSFLLLRLNQDIYQLGRSVLMIELRDVRLSVDRNIAFVSDRQTCLQKIRYTTSRTKTNWLMRFIFADIWKGEIKYKTLLWFYTMLKLKTVIYTPTKVLRKPDIVCTFFILLWINIICFLLEFPRNVVKIVFLTFLRTDHGLYALR